MGSAAFLSVKAIPSAKRILQFRRRSFGVAAPWVILAVSSKNDDATAREPFLDHPDMLMRESDIAVFQANWSDKATNLEAIAATLDIGVDSLVLLDDNPAERAQVREALPMVAVPELSDDPAQFARTLRRGLLRDRVAVAGGYDSGGRLWGSRQADRFAGVRHARLISTLNPSRWRSCLRHLMKPDGAASPN